MLWIQTQAESRGTFAFQDYYRTTLLAEEADPNKLHDLKAALDAAQVYSPEACPPRKVMTASIASTAILGLLPFLVLNLHGTEIEKPLAIVMAEVNAQPVCRLTLLPIEVFLR